MSESDKNITPQKSKFRRRLRAFFLIGLLFFLFFLLVSFSLQFLVNQHWGAKKVSSFLSEKIGTEVQLGHLSVNVFEGMVIEELLIRDHKFDTLIYAEKAKFTFASGMWGILNNEFDVKDIKLKNTQVNFVKYFGDERYNFSMVFSPIDTAFTTEQVNKPKLDLSLRYIDLENIDFRQLDYNKASEAFYFLPHGRIVVDDVDINANKYTFDKVNFIGLKLKNSIIYPEDWDYSKTGLEPQGSVLDSQEVDNGQEGSDTNSLPFTLTIRDLMVTEGDFELHNHIKDGNWDGDYGTMNYNHFRIDDIDIDVTEFKMTDLDFVGDDFNLIFKSPTGFQLNALHATEAHIHDRGVELYGMSLETPFSSIGDTLVLKYSSYEAWKDINNEIFIDADIEGSEISLTDIMNFAPRLYTNDFFMTNERQVLEIDGKIYGRINSLKGRDLEIILSDKFYFKGNANTRDLSFQNKQFLGLDIKKLNFDIRSLEVILPKVQLPSNFEKLGEINFNGRFDGYFLDFVTYGNLQTELGFADLDMRLDLKKGRDYARYSGELKMKDFNLSKWASTEELGKLDMSIKVKDGLGLTIDKAQADIVGKINAIEIKSHIYKDIDINAKLNKNSFDGSLVIKEDDSDFQFNGVIANLNSIPIYDFEANINTLRLKNLNLTKEHLDFGGHAKISLEGLEWDKLIGAGSLDDFWVVYSESDSLLLDTIRIAQTNLNNGRHLTLTSDFAIGEVKGSYDLKNIHNDFISIINDNHPKISELVGLPNVKNSITNLREYSLKLDLKDGKGVIDYFTKNKVSIRQVNLDAFLSEANQSIKFRAETPYLKIKNWGMDSLFVSLVNEKGLLINDVQSKSVMVNDKKYLSNVNFTSNLLTDAGNFKLEVSDPSGAFSSILLSADVVPEGKKIAMYFNPSLIEAKNKQWQFIENSKVVLGKEFIDLQDFSLYSDPEVLSINNINDNRGITISAIGLETDIIDSLIHLRGFDFDGRFNATLTLNDLFKMEGLSADIFQQDLILNDKSRGELNLSLAGPSLKEKLIIDAKISDGKSEVLVDGFYWPKTDGTGHEYNFNGQITNYPLEILEYIIQSGISETSGQISGPLQFVGKGKNFDVNGALTLLNGKSKVNYIGVKYFFDNQTIIFNKNELDFTGSIFKDSLNNIGVINGKLYHHSFKDWRMDIGINTNRLLALNTNKKDNPSYYGTVMTRGDVRFSGPINLNTIDIVATTMSGSNLTIPVVQSFGDTETGFVQFVNKNPDVKNDTTGFALKGIEVNMQLTITENALTSIVFDEQAGDILEGYGRGNMNVKVARSGGITVYGDYEIERGKYLFTLLNFVNKPFTVKRGGRIRWTGDAVNARINLEAQYANLNTPPYPLIQEYGLSEADEIEAKRSTAVDLTMILRGSLLQPEISFDIDLPDLSGQIKSYTDSKLGTISDDQDALNRQVFGLVVFGSFFQTDQQAASNLGSSTVNTISEFLTRQVSVFVSSLLNDIVKDVDFISGIDVDLNYIQTYGSDPSGTSTSSLDAGEYQFKVKNRLWNDKWVITLGGNYGSQSVLTSDPYFNPETVIEWNTPMNGLKLRVYYRQEESFQGQKQKIGGGIRYRKEFNSLFDFRKALSKAAKKPETL